MKTIANLTKKPVKTVVGIMSGTSVDGVDVSIVRIKGHGVHTEVQLLHFCTVIFEPEVKAAIFQLFNPQQATVDFVCHVNFLLGEVFAEAVLTAIEESEISLTSIDLISSHGQTAWHNPSPRSTGRYQTVSTLQVGEAAVIAERTGIPVVSDFRVRDMAAGGQGAPLVPLMDYFLFRDDHKVRVLINIGGIANMSILPASATIDQVVAFDTGPGNMVIDAMVMLGTKRRESFDRDGRYARMGQVDNAWLDELMRHPYFEILPPKTTGRELFGRTFSESLWAEGLQRGLSLYDIVATVTEWTAFSIASALRQQVQLKADAVEVVVSGGGSSNPVLMERVSVHLPEIELYTSDQFGVPSDAKESIAFAILGNEFLYEESNNVPSATGASHAIIMGKLSLP